MTPRAKPYDRTKIFDLRYSCGARVRGSIPTDQGHHRARARWLRRIFREMHVGPTHDRRERMPLSVVVEDELRLRRAIR